MEKYSDEIRAKIKALKQPTETQMRLAKICESHEAFVDILTETNKSHRHWDKVDRIAGDRLKHYVQTRHNMARTDPSDAPNVTKREHYRNTASRGLEAPQELVGSTNSAAVGEDSEGTQGGC